MTRAAVPQSWKLLYQDGDASKPVPDTGSEAVAKDAWNTLAFTPVTTSALRIEVELQPDSSGGILEWKVK